LKRLALLWLACAAVGFVVAACAAVAMALAFDSPTPWRSSALAGAATPQGATRNAAEAPRAIDTGRRLLGE
jgi:hypothetical protein